MKKYKLIEPYKKDNKTNLAFTIGKSGVYLIYKKGSTKPVYIGQSGSDIYKTITRHFQSWEDSTQIRITYPKFGYMVRVVFCTKLQALKLEKALIIKHKPQDNPSKYLNYTLSLDEIKTEQDLTGLSFLEPPF